MTFFSVTVTPGSASLVASLASLVRSALLSRSETLKLWRKRATCLSFDWNRRGWKLALLPGAPDAAAEEDEVRLGDVRDPDEDAGRPDVDGAFVGDEEREESEERGLEAVSEVGRRGDWEEWSGKKAAAPGRTSAWFWCGLR